MINGTSKEQNDQDRKSKSEQQKRLAEIRNGIDRDAAEQVNKKCGK